MAEVVLVPCFSGLLSIFRNGQIRKPVITVLVPCSSGLLSIVSKGKTVSYQLSCSRPLFFGVVIDHEDGTRSLNDDLRFSSPILRGSYRPDTSLNSITIRVQLLFWLSKNVTTNDTLLYRMSLFLTNNMMAFLILTVYYI